MLALVFELSAPQWLPLFRSVLRLLMSTYFGWVLLDGLFELLEVLFEFLLL